VFDFSASTRCNTILDRERPLFPRINKTKEIFFIREDQTIDSNLHDFELLFFWNCAFVFLLIYIYIHTFMQQIHIFCLFCLLFTNDLIADEIWLVNFSRTTENQLLLIEESFPFIDLLESNPLKSTYVFLLRHDDRTRFARFLSENNGSYRRLPNKILKSSTKRSKRWTPSEHPLDRTYYQHFLSYDEQRDWHQLLENSPLTKRFVRLHTIGQSYENRSLEVIELHTRRYPRRRRKHAVYIDGGMHAREWLSIGVANYIIVQFLREKKTNPKIQEIFRHFDVFVLPMMNPDGYEYSRTKNRLWRKNRSPTSHSEFWNGDENCMGIDLNRNFPHQWHSLPSSSMYACTTSYRGPQPSSEPEVLHVVNFLKRLTYPHPKFHAYFNLHAYGRFWLLPWAYTSFERVSNYDNLFERSNRIMTTVMNGTYKVGQASRLLYPCSGTSIDYAATLMPHSMTFELSPAFSILPMCTENDSALDETCTVGFMMGPDAIEIDGKEIFTAIVEYLYSVVQDSFSE